MKRHDPIFTAATGGKRLGAAWKVTADPAKAIQDVADLATALEAGNRGPTGWMQRAARRAQGLTVTPVGHTPKYLGRTCCFVHLAPFEGRGDVYLGLETTCPDCGRVFTLALEVR